MKIGTDKWKHFGINYAICALLGDYGVPFALGASLGKEYGDKMSPGNKWGTGRIFWQTWPGSWRAI